MAAVIQSTYISNVTCGTGSTVYRLDLMTNQTCELRFFSHWMGNQPKMNETWSGTFVKLTESVKTLQFKLEARDISIPNPPTITMTLILLPQRCPIPEEMQEFEVMMGNAANLNDETWAFDALLLGEYLDAFDSVPRLSPYKNQFNRVKMIKPKETWTHPAFNPRQKSQSTQTQQE